MKPKLFLDTNIMLDLLGEREPFYQPTAKLASLVDNGSLDFTVSALSFATVNYFLAKFEDSQTATEKLRKFRVLSSVVGVDEEIVDKGLNANFKDFEDALQYFCALKADCQVLITRNAKDFKGASIPVMTVDEYLKSIGKY
ncbi:type II toxin-antitoxin system VapC family toxin [Tunicatimonas pelagia]|uniref:type II toxin-antitoxin system VapC family toxin n=1 Tax=Tunicatimonas pelagia TaxID=931531 RepID=UPI002664EB15|nr:PIN domain-containing protein [Tunicatimonas pelagia]WKN41283.1 PIN domain-containing protein [Tunicatimonas pelagia]